MFLNYKSVEAFKQFISEAFQRNNLSFREIYANLRSCQEF